MSSFTSGGGVDEVLVRFLLIKQIIKGCQNNVHFIQLFSVKHPETYISGKKEFVRISQELLPICMHIHLTHN